VDNGGVTRIVAGTHRGRPLKVPAGEATRPTSDRAREGLFSSLHSLLGGEGLAGVAFLDLYAGSGALGLEALSRGAARATLVEDDPRALAALRDNAGALGLEPEVVDDRVERFLQSAAGGYDVAVLDPPYDLAVGPVLEQLVDVLEPDAVVAVERRSRGPELTWPKGLEPLRSRRYGEATLWYGSRS
jgi:16S rRNA (guanine966-N2)-methyltransferase